MTDQDAQDDELLALSSIYEENYFSKYREDNGGYFNAHIDLPQDFIIRLGPEGQNLHKVVALPPLLLNFQLPSNYPSESPPDFTLTCQWLSRSQLTHLCKKLDQLWAENEFCEVLFTWTDFLHNELMDFMDLKSPLDLNSIFDRKRRKRQIEPEVQAIESDQSKQAEAGLQRQESVDSEPDEIAESTDHTLRDPRAIQDLGSPGLLLASILEYDQLRRQEIFDGILFTCDICFAEKLGQLCTQFKDCRHVYCRDCIRTYLEVQIEDGNVGDLHCPYHDCKTQAHPSQIKELVSEDLFAKYDRLLLQSSLDRMSDICYCPRTDCQSPVLKDTENCLLGQCPKCYYVFCTVCLSAYHGTRTPCRLKVDSLKKLREMYMDATEEEKEFIMKRYGKRAVTQALEEVVSLEWLGANTKPCPDCSTWIQKMQGCNKMTCLKCRCYFCYLCGAKLHTKNPYSHYNVLKGSCFGKLFEGLEGEEDDDDEFDFLDDWM